MLGSPDSRVMLAVPRGRGASGRLLGDPTGIAPG